MFVCSDADADIEKKKKQQQRQCRLDEKRRRTSSGVHPPLALFLVGPVIFLQVHNYHNVCSLGELLRKRRRSFEKQERGVRLFLAFDVGRERERERTKTVRDARNVGVDWTTRNERRLYSCARRSQPPTLPREAASQRHDSACGSGPGPEEEAGAAAAVAAAKRMVPCFFLPRSSSPSTPKKKKNERQLCFFGFRDWKKKKKKSSPLPPPNEQKNRASFPCSSF